MAPYEAFLWEKMQIFYWWFEVGETGLIGPYLVDQCYEEGESNSTKVKDDTESPKVLH